MEKTDILIIGSGIAGLFFAVKTAQKRPDLSVTILTKASADNTNTRFAQGGIAVVTNPEKDSFEQHIRDTLNAGGGYCDEKIVRMVVQQAPKRLKELLGLGISFDTDASGQWNLGLEGGHSQHRILHHKDCSGLEIEKKLLYQIQQLPNILLLENHLSIDLSTENKLNKNYCTGAFYYNKVNGKVKHIRSKVTILSTGGCGQIFQNTTNPEIATGDGVAMAYRTGAVIQDMQYIQFHPTALYEENKNPFFLISEAVRGFGAYIVNKKLERFIFKHDIRGELATRDIVSQAIGSELQQTGEKYVYLDCRHFDFDDFYKHFPSITDYCIKIGLHPLKDLIPIVPVAHYQCGGIKVNKNAATSVRHLYAIGECARTGLHGKNRLASNSLLEALVFAHQCSKIICKTIDTIPLSTLIFINKYTNTSRFVDTTSKEHKKVLQKIMTAFYTSKTPQTAAILEKIEALKTEALQIDHRTKLSPSYIEYINMLTVAGIVLEHYRHTENILQLIE